jgi:glycosyltransferase involved in cell wall biosynthesis
MKFYLLGVGYYSPDLNALKKEIADKGLTKTIQLLPWLSHEETLKYLKYSLFYLTVSRYEGLSLSVIEAMALGKAVVASDVLGNCDCVKDGYNGRLLPLNEEKFCQAIVSLIEKDDIRHEFEKNSRTSFEKNFLIDHRIGELEKIYQNT